MPHSMEHEREQGRGLNIGPGGEEGGLNVGAGNPAPSSRPDPIMDAFLKVHGDPLGTGAANDLMSNAIASGDFEAANAAAQSLINGDGASVRNPYSQVVADYTFPSDEIQEIAEYGMMGGLEGRIVNTAYSSAVQTENGVAVTSQMPDGKKQGWVPSTEDPDVIKYDNGVIVNIGTGQILGVPPADPTIAGTTAWLTEVRKTWDESKVNSWRKRLHRLGYEVGEKGKYDQTFGNALVEFHTNKYLNYGDVVPKEDTKASAKQTVKDSIDPAEVRNAIRAQYQETIGDDPTDEELNRWYKFFMKNATKLARKGNTAEEFAGKANARMQEGIMTDPVNQKWAQQEEENTDVKDSFTRIAQVIGGLS